MDNAAHGRLVDITSSYISAFPICGFKESSNHEMCALTLQRFPSDSFKKTRHSNQLGHVSSIRDSDKTISRWNGQKDTPIEMIRIKVSPGPPARAVVMTATEEE
jgi:hypothetical protein